MPAMPSPGPRRWLRWGLVAAAILLVLAGGAAAFVLLHSPGNVSHPNLEFTAPTATTAAAAAKGRRPHTSSGRATATTTREPASSRPATGCDPPFHVGWTFEDYALLEFPPVIYSHTLYLLDDDGSAKALDKRTGHKLWETKVGTLAAASPALGIDQGLLFVPILSTNSTARPTSAGQRQARRAVDEDRPRRLVARVPRRDRVLAHGLAELGLLRRPGRNRLLAARPRRPRELDLSRQGRGQGRPGARLRAPLLRRLRRPCVRPERRPRATRSGRSAPAGPTSGSARGTSTPRRRSRSAACTWATPTAGCTRSPRGPAQLAWATSTGAYVYASPAVADIPGLGPTVYEGSYDGNFYAFNAQSGAIRWRIRRRQDLGLGHDRRRRRLLLGPRRRGTRSVWTPAPGTRCSRSPTARSTRSWPTTATVYLTGYTKLYQLIPTGRRPATSSRRKISPQDVAQAASQSHAQVIIQTERAFACVCYP